MVLLGEYNSKPLSFQTRFGISFFLDGLDDQIDPDEQIIKRIELQG